MKKHVIFWVLIYLLLAPIRFSQAAILPACSGIATTNPPVPACEIKHVFELLVNIFNFLLGLSAIVAILFIVWAGLRMAYHSFTEDSESELRSAKLTLSRAITGFALIACSYLIINTVLVLLGITDLNTLFGNLGLGSLNIF